MKADQLRQEQHRQTQELYTKIATVIDQHGKGEATPMLGAPVSALAEMLGQTIGLVADGRSRKALRDAAEKAMRRAEKASLAKPLGEAKAITVAGRH